MVTTSYPRWPGDLAGGFIEDLAGELAARHGVSVRVVASWEVGSPRGERSGRVEVIRFPYFFPARLQRLAYGAGMPTNLRTSRLARLQVPSYLACFLHAARRAMAGCDLVHAHWIESGLVALWNRGAAGLPLVVSVHRFNPSRLARPLYRHLLARADAVLFNSSYTQRRAEALCRSVRGRVVHPPVGADANRPTGPNLRERLGIRPDDVVVGTLGRMVEVKGQGYLIEAFARLARRPERLVLLVGGSGPLDDELRRQVGRLNLGERVRWAGALPKTDVPAFMRTCDVFCCPSIVDAAGDTEALGMALAEAMACGVPCVASRVGGIPDSVIDGQTGLLVPQKDPDALARGVVRLLDEPPLRRHLVEAARRHVEEHFSLDAVGRAMRKTYDEVLGRRH